MAGKLPTDLIVDILSRLPARSLLRCRLVCKSWLSLISSSEFILMHAQNFNQQNPRILVRRVDGRDNKEIYSVHFDDESFSVDAVTSIDAPINRNCGLVFYFRIIGSCNGIVCLSEDVCGSRKDKIILWNPSIRRKLTLIPPMHRSGCGRDFFPVCGFGYDRISDDYKVVRLAYHDSSFATPQVEVYSVKTAIWRETGFPHGLPCCSIFPNWSQVFFNGSVHWIACDWTPGHCSILTFDLSTELFGEIELPEDLVGESPFRLVITAVRGSLAVIYSSRFRTPWSGSSTYVIWAMKEYKDPSSWTMIYNMHYPDSDVGRALWLRNNGDMLMESIYGDLAIHNSKVPNYVYPSCMGLVVIDSVFVDKYQESLALLDAGHDVRVEEQRAEEGPGEGYEDAWFARYEAPYVIPSAW